MSQIVRETRHSPLVFATLTFISFIAILYSNDFYLVFSPSLQRHQLTTLHNSTPSFVDFKDKSSNETSKVMIPFAVGKAPEECDIFSGKWIRDTEDRPLYEESECPYIHSQLLCQEYGRPDKGYQSWRWQPHDCNLPKFNATLMLEALRGKRMLFVGDSLMRGQFESMICLVHRLVPENGKSKKGSYESLSVFSLKDYNATIEFYWAPFLLESNGDGPYNSKINESIIRKGSIANHGKFWEGADVVSFGTYLWWFNQNNFKIVNGSFSDEVSVFEIMKNEDAYRMAIQNMLEWIQRKIDQNKTRVFFTSMSPTHRRSIQWGGEPDGNCYNETTPIMDPEYNWRLSSHEIIMKIIDEEFGKSSVPISLLNITLLSSYRKDAHTQIYKKQWKPLTPEQQADPKSYADCVHWCLPGLHDTWNELLFAKLFYP